MTTIARAVCEKDNLLQAWEVVRDNDLADGVQASGAARFAAQVTTRIDGLASDLADGRFRPAPVTRVDIPKPDGGVRRLRVPSIPDRVVERAVAQVLGPRLDPWFSPWSFAYRTGLGVTDALRALVQRRDEGCTFVVRSDFTDCFDRLRRDLLLDVLRRRVDDAWLLGLVRRLLERPERVDGRVIATAVGANQGGPLSPLLCNLLLTRFDDAMLGHGFPTVRYADDFAIAVPTEEDAKMALSAARKEAARLALDLAEDKTEILGFAEGFVFLGEDVNLRYPELPELARIDEPSRRALFVGRQGATVRIEKGQVRVTHRDAELLAVPSAHVDQIVAFGSVMLTPGLLSFAASNGVTVTLLSRKGWLQAWLDGPGLPNAALRRSQYRRSDDPSFRAALARTFVAGKLGNQRALLARYIQSERLPLVLGAIVALDEARSRALEAPTVEVLLGIEGSAAATYFRALGELVPEDMQFDRRSRRPPRDPVNALLSFGYAVLATQAVGAVVATGLDASCGFLHADDQRRPSLALDLMEEFRPVVVDTVVLEVLRRRRIKVEHFAPDEVNGGVLIKPKAKATFIAALEERLLTVFAHVPSGRRVSYRRALFLQSRQIGKAVRAAEPEYQPISWR